MNENLPAIDLAAERFCPMPTMFDGPRQFSRWSRQYEHLTAFANPLLAWDIRDRCREQAVNDRN